MKIEEIFEELEQILGKMEDPGTGLEDSFALYEKGTELLRQAGKSIAEVEGRLAVLNAKKTEDENGL